ncbi:uncharacterized protein LOC127916982 isoform X1 [Oncorhynchus keta]|uniref:uncharacterized protein LOC127916982 isoform X1 n=1 Tax=Oncorhynchus keta TaxID=8018 RepID=UPI00227AEEDC|nr:uncharacterized protein LOC127916982 isoform X1 [Oncorhynchus keta]XP_052356405.1 uncharacterized protein LOC127916982 isoform X1 [Oncorhynchus keta]
MSYHQGAEGGAIPKERQKDGSQNKDFDETMDPDMRGQSERAESISSGFLSMKTDKSMDIPVHFKVADSLHNKGPVDVSCDICSEVEALKFCQTCSVSYCETHIRQHYTIPKLKRHTLVDVTGDLVQKLCQHDYSPLDVFCRTDQMMICSQCAETNHKGHDTTILETKKAGRQPKSFDRDQHTTLAADDVLPPPGDFQVLLLTSDSVSLSWGPPEELKGPQKFRVTWGCDVEPCSIGVKNVHEVEISRLNPGKKYQFNVATEGEDGSQSRWISASLSAVPPAPDQLNVDSVDTTSAAVSWNQPPGLDQTQHQYQISYHCPGTEPHITTTSSPSITL